MALSSTLHCHWVSGFYVITQLRYQCNFNSPTGSCKHVKYIMISSQFYIAWCTVTIYYATHLRPWVDLDQYKSVPWLHVYSEDLRFKTLFCLFSQYKAITNLITDLYWINITDGWLFQGVCSFAAVTQYGFDKRTYYRFVFLSVGNERRFIDVDLE